MNSVPEMCMEYTKVFQVVKLEWGLIFLAGMACAFLLHWLENR